MKRDLPPISFHASPFNLVVRQTYFAGYSVPALLAAPAVDRAQQAAPLPDEFALVDY
ncbi:MAG: hypothetical protein KF893_14600 [Caldilineaceae bacterium]|nr:hypothetical protein [Caldilineaceae bacterium]